MTSVSRGRPVPGRPRRRAGWWFWGPFLWGLFFLIPGIGLLVGAQIVGGSARGGLDVTGILFTVMGAGGLGVAWYAYRDIHEEDPAPPLPGTHGAAAEEELKKNGVRGSATVNDFMFVAGSTADGSTLVQLTLEVTTVAMGTVPLTTKARVPVWLSDRLTKGSTVPVVMSPTNPGNMDFEWEGLVAGALHTPGA
jgi:hypothetical protein